MWFVVRNSGLIALVLAVLSRCASAATFHVDDFETFVELDPTLGWAGNVSPTRVASGGPGDSAYLEISTFNFHLATRNDEPRWTGDFVALGATRIVADLMAPEESLPLEMRLVLFGPANIANRWVSAQSQVVPNDGVWRRYEFSLAESDLVAVNTGASHAALLADVERVMFRYDEMADGPDYDGGFVNGTGKLGLDNLQLAGPAAATPGDFDGDGDVDGADLGGAVESFSARFGEDLAGEDFLAWQRNFGQTAVTAAAGQVPEPATWALALVWGIGPAARRRTASWGR